MSKSSMSLSPEHFAYIAAHTRGEDPFLGRLRAAAVAAGLPAIHISPEQAVFMQILLRLRGAREVVEVGTLGGYSAIAMARALPAGGRVRTVELEPDHAAFARRWVADSDVADRVEVLEGDGRHVLPQISSGSADAAFIDADKPGYPVYLHECLRICRSGGLLMADNALAFGHLLDDGEVEDSVYAIREFNELMPSMAELTSIIVPVGDGCWVAVKD